MKATLNVRSVGSATIRLLLVAGFIAATCLTQAQTNIPLVPAGAVWKYLDTGVDQGTAWIAPGFNDSTWPSGPAQLGYGDGDEATVVGFGADPNNKYITTYFRRSFVVSNPSAFTNVQMHLLYDDGAVVYLNGAEVFRGNLPAGATTFSTLALTAVENESFHPTVIPRLLVNGTNVMAVEVHQSAANSSDLSFDCAMAANVGIPVPGLPPQVTVQPLSQTNFVGSTVTFNVTAIGTPPLVYQWFFGGYIPGATNATLVLTNIQLSNAGAYRVIVFNAYEPTAMAEATLTVTNGPTPPSISRQPVSQTNVVGSTVTFSISAFATPPKTYQWQKDGTDLSGETNSTLTLANLLPADAGGYRVIVCNVLGCVTSDEATLTVLSGQLGPAVVINEVLAHNQSFTNADGTVTAWVELRNATCEALDLTDCSLSDEAMYPRRWIFPTGAVLPPNGLLVVRCDGSSPPSTNMGEVLNTGFGLKANGDSVYLFDRIPNDGGALLDEVTFGLQAGDFSLGRVPDATGSWTLCRPTPVGPNVAASLGDPAAVKINEWMSHPQTGSDWFELYNPQAEPVALGGCYLTDNLDNPTQYCIPPYSYLGSGGNSFVVFYADHDVAAGADHTGFRLGNGGGEIGLFSATAEAIDTAMYGAQPEGISEGRLPDGGTTIVQFPGSATPGASNHPLVPEAPMITQQPVSQTNIVGSTVSFTITATGTPPLAYQWQKDGANLSGETSSSLTLVQVRPSAAGQYLVAVSNSGGSVTSAVATLTVLPPSMHPGAFDPSFRADFNEWATFWTMVQQTDGKLVLCGDFSSVSGVSWSGLVRLYADGSLDTNYQPRVENPDVFALALQADGKLVIGGGFMRVNGVPRQALARLNPDGTLDESFAPAMPSNGWVGAVAMQADGKVLAALAGGTMTNATECLVRFDGDGSLDGGFSVQAGAAFVPLIHKIVVQPDGAILIGGVFSSINGIARNGISRLLSNGSVDLTFNPGTGAEGPVSTVVLQPDGKVLVGGFFTAINGVPRSRIARLNADGSVDTSFSASVDDGVSVIVPRPDGKLLIGGFFSFVGGTPHNGIARLDADGSLDATFDPGSGIDPISDGSVRAIAVQGDGKIVIAGDDFLSFDGFPCNSICRLYDNPIVIAPAIASQPVSQTNIVGSTVSFTITATGTPPLAYQWQKDGANLSGQTNASLTLANVQLSDAGRYRVIVSNAGGNVTSAEATLTVLPGQPLVVLGSLDTSGYADGVAVSGNYAYVADGAGGLHGADGLQVVDISNPASPWRVARYDTPGYAAVVLVSGDYAYVADYFAGVQVIDVSDPMNPRQVGAYHTNGMYANALGASGNYLLVGGDEILNLRVLDVSDPANPRQVGGCQTGGVVDGIAVSGRYAFLADGDFGLRVVDISDPSHPQLVANCRTADDDAIAVVLSGHYAYLADEAGLKVIDISDPTNPGQVGACNISGYAVDLTIVGHYAYLASPDAGVQAIDISDPANPRLVGGNTSLSAFGIVASGEILYVAAASDGLVILSGMPESYEPPTIASQPVGQTNFVGSTVTFSVTASGTPPLSYQWQKDGANLSCQTNASLTLANVQLADAGQYRVIVSNAAGSTTSSEAQLTVTPVSAGTVSLIPTGAVWKYLDTGVDQGTAWIAPGFNDSTWPSGPAQLGYGDGDEATVVGFGPDPNNKYITSYFRHSFVVNDPSTFTNVQMRLVYDDGVVLYLNGTEIFRANLPAGAITSSTLALTAVENESLHPTVIPRLLVNGTNHVAVEVHQNAANSSDLSFELSMAANVGIPVPGLPPFVVRHIDSQNFTVQLTAAPPASVTAYLVEEQVPVPFWPINISHGGVFDPTNRVLRFGPFNDHEARTLSYVLEIPDGDCLRPIVITGQATGDGIVTRVVGDVLFGPTELFPADFSPTDGWVSSNEVAAYSAAWRQGQSWPRGPSPVSLDYVARAAALWQGNDAYYFDPLTISNPPTLRWLNFGAPFPACVRYPSPLPTGSAESQLPATYFPAQPFLVVLTVTPAPNVTACTVEDQPPAGWAVGNISDGGEWDTRSSKVKFGPFLGPQVRALSYQVTPPAEAQGDQALAGAASFDGVTVTVTGARMIRAAGAPEPPTITGQPMTQIVVEGTTATFTVTATGTPPLSYQWYFDRAMIPGVTAATLTLPNVQRTNAGSYEVRVSNAHGRADAGATLIVYATQTGPGSVDGSFPTLLGFPDPEFGPSVRDMVKQPDGKVILCGTFTTVNGISRENLARLLPNGELDLTFNPPVANTRSIDSLALQVDGKLIVGSRSGEGLNERALARVNPDGTLDSTFASPFEGEGCSVSDVIVQPDGKILAAGWLAAAGLSITNRIVRLQPDGSLDATFQSSVLHFLSDGFVRTLALQSDGRILVAGRYGSINGDQTHSSLARLNADGSLDLSFHTAIEGYGVYCVKPLANGQLLVGGDMVEVCQIINGETTNCIMCSDLVRLNPDGTLDTAFTAATEHMKVNVIEVQPDGRLVIGGYGHVPGNMFFDYVTARLNADGSVDQSFIRGSVLRCDGIAVNALALMDEGKLLVGGAFCNYNGIPSQGFVLLNGGASAPDCRLSTSVCPRTGQPLVMLTGPTGARFLIEATSDLKSWTPLMTVTNTLGSVQVCDPTANGSPQRFYRATLLP